MSILKYFHTLRPKKTAAVAKERLQIIVAHERNLRDSPVIEYLPMLQQELLEVVRKYIAIRDEDIKINIENDGECEILELNITLSDENQ